MLRNPFHFVLQVVTLVLGFSDAAGCCIREGSSCEMLLRSLGPHVDARGLLPRVDSFTDPFVTALTFRPTSVTSFHVTEGVPIKAAPGLCFDSGSCSSSGNNMLRNPFHFVLQVVTLVLGFSDATGCCIREGSSCEMLLRSLRPHVDARGLFPRVDSFTDPFVTALTFRPTSVTSFHVTEGVPIKAAPGLCFDSGPCSSSGNNMLRNPFHFVLQVVTLVLGFSDAAGCCIREGSSCEMLLRSLGPHVDARGLLPRVDSFTDPFVTALTFRPTSVTSFHVTEGVPIKAAPGLCFDSGPCSSSGNNMLRNPFHFVLQVVTLVLGFSDATGCCIREGSSCEMLLRSLGPHVDARGLFPRVDSFTDLFVTALTFRPTSVTSFHVTEGVPIKAAPGLCFDSGPCSSSGNNMLRNPFHFVLQVVTLVLGFSDATGCCIREGSSCEMLLRSLGPHVDARGLLPRVDSFTDPFVTALTFRPTSEQQVQPETMTSMATDHNEVKNSTLIMDDVAFGTSDLHLTTRQGTFENSSSPNRLPRTDTIGN
ncbi:hypothetical protein MTO96_049764 [Rhipicephalus appendiculatus]